ncbi:Polyamine N-acetyltransferase 1 [Nakaseomyces bracarensis]|uniref:Polyamine N-acetyltransferase 1 n=1 Tax=Nakaseomyces bracarensis TaxID=273131 RepID=A0ABR4NZE9_9SACH
MSEHINEDDKNLCPLALLMDELKHDDIANRVEAMKKLDTIALALGPERTREELIPFLSEVAQDDEDEVFAVLAEELGKFVPLVGGPEYATILLPTLEILAATEETLVREKALDSLNVVANELSVEQLLNSFVPLLDRLANADWFSSKVSACGMFKVVVGRAKDDTLRKNLLALYLQLVQDDTPMVRRAAAKHLPSIIDQLRLNPGVSSDDDWESISNMFQKVISDNQDSVKFLAVESLIAILKFFSAKNDQSHSKALVNYAVKLSKDEAWRVRYMVAEKYEELAEEVSKSGDGLLDELLEPFLNLCKDNESDVRKVIAEHFAGYCKYIKKDYSLYELKIFPAMYQLSCDEVDTVRAALASTITNMSPLLLKESVTEEFIPIVLNMLKDNSSDVRLNIIAGLKHVNNVVPIDVLSESLLPAVNELAKDINWRVRMAVIEYLPVLAEQLGVNFFNENLIDLCMSLLWDPVYAVRNATVTIFTKLTDIFGSDWCRDEIISKLLDMDPQLLQNFIYRFTLLSTLRELSASVNSQVTIDKILPFVTKLAEDEVPNIKFNVAKSYLIICQNLSIKKEKELAKIMENTIIPSLEKLCQDEDIDVRYFANGNLEKCQEMLKSA